MPCSHNDLFFLCVQTSQFSMKSIESSKFLIIFIYPKDILKTIIIKVATECRNRDSTLKASVVKANTKYKVARALTWVRMPTLPRRGGLTHLCCLVPGASIDRPEI